jgi:glycerol-3-phosphate dehydrogenase (NAD(P)+)
VRLWGRDASLVRDMRARRANAVYLPDILFPKHLEASADLAEVVHDAALVVSAVPSHGTRDVIRSAAPHLAPGAIVVSAAKGLEQDTLFRVSEIIEQELGGSREIVVLSGPSFAAELARQLPTAVSVASAHAGAVERVQADFRAPYFRLYASDDVVGVEIGGALKNVIAIAAGVVEGLGLGHNALAGLITRGLAEITRLACAAGARRETLAGLTGLGDLVLTCTGSLSRNRHVGIELARGRSLRDVLAGMKMVAEGVRTTDAGLALGVRHGVELPITAQVAELLAGRKDARAAVFDLMLRPQRAEAG